MLSLPSIVISGSHEANYMTSSEPPVMPPADFTYIGIFLMYLGTTDPPTDYKIYIHEKLSNYGQRQQQRR